MGRIIEVVILVVLIAITTYYYVKARKEANEKAKEATDINTSENNETKFVICVGIDGMMCEKCASRVIDALGRFGSVEVSLEKKTATITSDELIDAAELENAVTELGYKFEGIIE